jgi:hypothetical protein
MQLLLALQQLLDDCGLAEVTPRVWVARVDGVIPGIGYHIRRAHLAACLSHISGG